MSSKRERLQNSANLILGHVDDARSARNTIWDYIGDHVPEDDRDRTLLLAGAIGEAENQGCINAAVMLRNMAKALDAVKMLHGDNAVAEMETENSDAEAAEAVH